MSDDEALAVYVEQGLDGLAGILSKCETGYDRQVLKGAMSQFLYSTFDDPNHPLWSFVIGYVNEYWIAGEGPIIPPS